MTRALRGARPAFLSHIRSFLILLNLDLRFREQEGLFECCRKWTNHGVGLVVDVLDMIFQIVRKSNSSTHLSRERGSEGKSHGEG